MPYPPLVPVPSVTPDRVGNRFPPTFPLQDGDSDVSDFFRRIAHRVTLTVGSWQFFLVSVLLLTIWAATGPLFRFSDTWQLLVNTSTTILTYLLGILILLEANRQAKESRIVHDELLESIRGASNALVNIDQMSEKEIDAVEEQLRARARRGGRANGDDTRPGRDHS
jgi:low affinity Fe/Cu permease